MDERVRTELGFSVRLTRELPSGGTRGPRDIMLDCEASVSMRGSCDMWQWGQRSYIPCRLLGLVPMSRVDSSRGFLVMVDGCSSSTEGTE